MDGHWSIVKGWNGLEGVSGQGTFLKWDGAPEADYSGVVEMK